MSVSELIQKLQKIPQNLEVYVHDNEEGPLPVRKPSVGKWYRSKRMNCLDSYRSHEGDEELEIVVL